MIGEPSKRRLITLSEGKDGRWRWHFLRNGRVMAGSARVGYTRRGDAVRSLEVVLGGIAQFPPVEIVNGVRTPQEPFLLRQRSGGFGTETIRIRLDNS